jgi:Glycosyl transferase family 2
VAHLAYHYPPIISRPPLTPKAVVVSVPARDEAKTIAQTVRALCAQVDGAGQPLSGVQILIVANNCTDDTARRAREAATPGTAIEVVEADLSPEQANVVGARRLALDLAAQRAGPGGSLVSTDADTLPEPDWLWQLCAPLRAGMDASAGRILLSPGSRAALPESVRRTYQLDTGYRLGAEALTERLNPQPHDPWPRHHQHFGANLALTVQAYRAVGGVPQVDALEDVALVRALARCDLRLRHTPLARVYTSARLCGRVDLGLSTQLREWCAGPEFWTVPGGPELAALARAEAALRAAWTRRLLPNHMAASGHGLADGWMAPGDVLDAALEAPTLGLALEAAHTARLTQGDWAAQFPAVPVRQAWEELRTLLEGGLQAASVPGLGSAADD